MSYVLLYLTNLLVYSSGKLSVSSNTFADIVVECWHKDMIVGHQVIDTCKDLLIIIFFKVYRNTTDRKIFAKHLPEYSVEYCYQLWVELNFIFNVDIIIFPHSPQLSSAVIIRLGAISVARMQGVPKYGTQIALDYCTPSGK